VDIEIGIERLTALAFIITGLSHITSPKAWVRFFVNIREQGEAAGLINAFVHIPLGLLIMAFHPVWSGAGRLVTLIGCALILKGTLYFLWPKLATFSLARVTEDKAWHFQFAGALSVALGITVGWIAITNANGLTG